MKKTEKKSVIILSTEKIHYDGHYYLIVRNLAAGRRDRYTVYRIPSAEGSRRIIVIGRELPLGFAKRYIKKYAKSINEKV